MGQLKWERPFSKAITKKYQYRIERDRLEKSGYIVSGYDGGPLDYWKISWNHAH